MKSKKLDWDKLNSWSNELKNSDNRNDWVLYVYVQLALRTALRVRDILNLKLSDFDFKENTLKTVTDKTNTAVEFYLPKDLMLFIKGNFENDQLFFNAKYRGIYSSTWVNLRLKKQFGQNGVSSHSIRKSAGLKMYEHYGINGARQFLTHSSFKHTSTYLELEAHEMARIQKSVFAD